MHWARRKKRAKTDFQKSPDIPTYTAGDTDCSKCPFKGKTTHALKLHIMKYHENEYLYVCEICEKGFTQKEGYNNHQIVHADESERVPCEVEDCDVTFVSRRNMKAHVKNMHGSRRFFCMSALQFKLPHKGQSHRTCERMQKKS